MNSLDKYYEKYKKLSLKCNLEGKEAIEAVRENGYALQYVKTQTPEICLEAVRENGYALQYVKTQTPEICLEAVRKNGDALRFVETQTPEICLEAVRQEGYALQFVNEDMFSKVKELTVKEIEKLLGYSIKIVK